MKNPKRSTDETEGELFKRRGEVSLNETSEFPDATTTISSIIDSEDVSSSVTTTESSNPLFTETVFGSRPSTKDDSEESDQLSKRKRNTSLSGVKGGKLIKFNRIKAPSPSTAAKSAKSSALNSPNTSTSASFFNRYKFASHQQLQQSAPSKKTPSAKLIASTSRFASASAFRSRSPSSVAHSSSHLPFTSHLSSSSLNHRSKHHRA